VYVWASDPWHNVANANIRKLVMTPRDKLQEVSIFSKRGEWTLKKGVRAGKVDLPTDFSVSFGLTPTKKINGWANILHVTATGGNCCRYGDRVPAIWFYSRTTRFHMIDGHQRVGNDECPIRQELPLNKRTAVKIVHLPTQCTVFFNGKKMCTEKRADRRQFREAQVWAADPWHNVAAAKMDNLLIKSARALGKPPPPPPPAKKVTLINGATALRRNRQLARTDMPTDYTVTFDLYPKGKVNGWANIIHFSATGGNCCSYGDRVPAIWFYSRSTRFHMIDGHARVGNDECPITDQLPLNKWTSVKIEMLPDSVYVSFNGLLKCTEKRQGRKFFPKVYVWASDPWHNVANANIRKLVMTPRDKLQEVSIFSKRGEWTLKKGVRAGKVDLPTDFSVSFGLTPTKKINGWANILHVTATGGNCCRYGDRVPAIWFYSRTTRFHMIDGHQRVGNDECPITQQLPLNKRTNVKIDMRPTQCNVYFNNKKMCTEKRADRKKFKKATVWAADPWHNVAAAKMYNLRFSSARVEGSTGGKSCKGDIDGNNKVNIEDLLALLGNYGKTGTNKADGNGDKKVDIEDLLIVLGAYGKSC